MQPMGRPNGVFHLGLVGTPSDLTERENQLDRVFKKASTSLHVSLCDMADSETVWILRLEVEAGGSRLKELGVSGRAHGVSFRGTFPRHPHPIIAGQGADGEGGVFEGSHVQLHVVSRRRWSAHSSSMALPKPAYSKLRGTGTLSRGSCAGAVLCSGGCRARMRPLRHQMGHSHPTRISKHGEGWSSFCKEIQSRI